MSIPGRWFLCEPQGARTVSPTVDVSLLRAAVCLHGYEAVLRWQSRHFEKQIVHSTPTSSTGTMPRGRPRKLRVQSNDETGNKYKNATNKKYRLSAIQITRYRVDKEVRVFYNNISM